jgi:hypothetical protein
MNDRDDRVFRRLQPQRKLIEAALAQLRDRGVVANPLSQLDLEAVCEQAGYTPAMLIHYWSESELFVQDLLRLLLRLPPSYFRALYDQAMRHHRPYDRLVEWLRGFFDLHLRDDLFELRQAVILEVTRSAAEAPRTLAVLHEINRERDARMAQSLRDVAGPLLTRIMPNDLLLLMGVIADEADRHILASRRTRSADRREDFVRDALTKLSVRPPA